MSPRNDPCGTPIQYSAVQSAPEMKLMIWLEHVLVPPTRYVSNHRSAIPDSPYDVFGVESRCCGPPCRKLRTNPATPVQISYRRQWRVECPTELSTRRFQLSGQHDMRRSSPAKSVHFSVEEGRGTHVTLSTRQWWPLTCSVDRRALPLTSNRHHLSYDDCLENKGRLQDCSCSIGSYHCIQCYAHIL